MAAVTMAAAAAPVANRVTLKDAKIQEMAISQNSEVLSAKKNVKSNVNRQGKKVTSPQDLLGSYVMHFGLANFSSIEAPGYITPYFVQGDSDNEIIIKQMPFSDADIVAYVDMAKGTFTINKQDLFYASAEGKMCFFQPLIATIDENEGTISYADGDKLVMYFDEDGFIEEGSLKLKNGSSFAVTTFSGFGWMVSENSGYWGVRALRFEPVEWFDFGASSWTNAGEAQVTDDFMVHMFKDSTPVQSTAGTFVKVGDNNIIALRNPYSNGKWTQMNGRPDAEGFYVVDITFPDCVPTSLYTLNGFWYTDEDADGNEIEEGAAAYNEEGTMVTLDGYTAEEVYDEYSVIEVECSTFDKATRTLTLRNLWFGTNTSPLDRYGFVASKNPDGTVKEWYPCTVEFVLPDMSGVNEVEFDANAPVKYFNLQGMEIANPAKGQVVIKTQGKKAEKIVVR